MGMLTPREIAGMIDISAVKPDSTLDELREAADLARKHNCICVIGLPAHTPLLVELLSDRPDVLVGGAVGFPSGGQTTAIKVAETRELIEMGCSEIDVAINIAWLKAGMYDLVRTDIDAVVEASGLVPVKVILECHYLTDGEIVKASDICAEAGVKFVKTSTGWASTGATPENIALMKQTVGERCFVKAAGGVKDLQTLLALYELGARRFGIGVRTAEAILREAAESS
ncbi:MAG: deoxyribose-phosphate aldolase [Phycisphaerae bacterium]|jgi:deoxyribose-phosphate aldolase|nr:deoxyribose-phosphate aldolase [Phycisphaerae bacterium]